jgi:glutathione S-transferase
MLQLYENPASGNCMKARILLRHLGIPYESLELDIFAGEATEPDHSARNPSRETPTLELETGEFVSQSGAVLLYLAEGTPYLPDDPVERAQVYQRLVFKQNGIEPGIATTRYMRWKGPLDVEKPKAFADRIARGEEEFDVLEAWLSERVESQPGFVNDLAPFP